VPITHASPRGHCVDPSGYDKHPPRLAHPRNHWQLTAGFCPGIGQGPVIPPEEIKQRLKDFRD